MVAVENKKATHNSVSMKISQCTMWHSTLNQAFTFHSTFSDFKFET